MKKMLVIMLCVIGLCITGCKKEPQVKSQADVGKCWETYQTELTNYLNAWNKSGGRLYPYQHYLDECATAKQEYEDCIAK